MLTPSELAQLVLSSRDRMNDSGEHWIKGNYVQLNDSGEKAYCSAGAVRTEIFGKTAVDHDLATTSGQYNEIMLALAKLIRREADEGRYNGPIYSNRNIAEPTALDYEGTVIDWNDYPDTTWEDVHRLFTEAAESL